MKLIDLHKEWCEKGNFGQWYGLCGCVECFAGYSLDLFKPENTPTTPAYWAAEGIENKDMKEHGYTPLRQTIVLLICAMNNEL